ncbi:hypothetical protein [Phyllobacterium sp. OV277]|uniref:hypothetical protein n=1 Tax=Phyllobacterium sp. OV277 TaxID=1882772 RepID=UPI0008824D12|nr:hypothetical protein [Phyllobacterium sp. OV277]SDP13713.1 hypothetical protein SAMN05443582_103501 [Phyllobacterium sp. OV277]
MTTGAQIRKMVKPLLERHSDLAMVGRFMVVGPIHHLRRGIYLDYCRTPEMFNPRTVVDILIPPSDAGYLGRGDYLTDPGRGFWDATNPDAVQRFFDLLEDKILPRLRSTKTFDHYRVLTERYRASGDYYDRDRFFEMLIATAVGDFDLAQSIVEPLPDMQFYLAYLAPSFYPALLARDRAEIAKILHAWEAQTIKTYKLEKFWEPTPFPLELEVSR